MFRDYLQFTKSERRGTFTLIVLIFFFAFIPKMYSYFFPMPSTIDYEKIAPLITKWDSLRPDNDSIPVELFVFNPNTITRPDLQRLGFSKKLATNFIGFRTKVRKFEKKEDLKLVWDMTDSIYQIIAPYANLSQEKEDEQLGFATAPKLFEFDPNTVTKAELKQLGLSEKTAHNLVNYRNKGKVFYKKSDIKTVWGFTEADYQKLEPYISIQKGIPDDVPTAYDNNSVQVNVNTATADEFQALKGIGEKTAERIIKFRNTLGGFVSVEQVSETWGLPKETFYNLKPQFTITNDNIQTINLNTATQEVLSKHPYLKWKQADAIIKYRAQHGNFQTVRDIKSIKIIDGTTFTKIAPYLTIEE